LAFYRACIIQIYILSLFSIYPAGWNFLMEFFQAIT
jgi:hypothetical protein